MKPLIVAATLAAGLIGTNAQSLSSEDIAAAIEQGKAGKKIEKKCTGKNDNAFDIVAEGPVGRIMRAAREAKRKKQEFTAADVTPQMAGAWLTVTASRVEWLRKQVMGGETPNSQVYRYQTEFYIKSKPPRSEDAIILRPLGLITYDSSNAPGSRSVISSSGPVPENVLSRMPLPGSDMAASFDLAAFKAIPHKNVEIYVFMTDAGGHGCKISEKERKTLQ